MWPSKRTNLPQGPIGGVVDLPETETLIEVLPAGFGVGEENLLPDGCVRLEDRGHQGPPDPDPPRVRLDQDVLDVADAHPLEMTRASPTRRPSSRAATTWDDPATAAGRVPGSWR